MSSSDNSEYEPSTESEGEEGLHVREPSSNAEPNSVPKRPIWEYRTLRCAYPDCSFSCANHRRFNAHLEQHECKFCGSYFADISTHFCPLEGQYKNQYGTGNVDTSFFQLIKSAHDGVVQTFQHTPDKNYISITSMFIDLDKAIRKLLKQAINSHDAIKVQFLVLVDLYDIKKQITKKDVWLSTSYLAIRHINFITNYLKYALEYINNTLSIYNENGSGYTLSSINQFQIIIASYKPLAGLGYIPLPASLRGRKGLLNIESTDSFCFHYCLVASQFQVQALKLYKDKKRASLIRDQDTQLNQKITISAKQRNKILKDPSTFLPFLDKLDFKGLRIPVPIEDFDIFEQRNDLSINCFELNGKKIKSIRTTQEEKESHVNLLLHSYNGLSHYVLITNVSAFLGRNHKDRHVYCKYCLRRFRQQHALNCHLGICVAKNKQPMRFPKQEFYEFKSMHETLRFPFVLYFDIESFNKKIEVQTGENTTNTGLIEPAQYSLILVGEDGLLAHKIYDGPNVIDNLIYTAEKMANDVRNFLKETNNRISLTYEQEEEYRNATTCTFCNVAFTKRNGKVRHHEHYSGRHLYIICSICNKRARVSYIVPMLSHGGTNFDHTLIIKGLKRHRIKSLKIIPQTSQHFLGFILNNRLKFMDSFKFSPFSLASLSKALAKDGDKGFEILFQFFKNLKPSEDFYKKSGYSIDELRLLIRKQPFPYDIMTDSSCFELTELPAIEYFRNSLKMKECKPKTYAHANLVWKTFQIKNFRQYSRLYCMVDTLLLSCIMETQRLAAFKQYSLDMYHKFSNPGFSFSAGMFSSNAKIAYMKDEKMVEMIRNSIRGGVCFCNSRLERGNNERIGSFDSSQPRKHIFYADLSSLYPHCLKYPIPCGNYRWLTDAELEKLDVANLPTDTGKGYILECDLLYPARFHTNQNDLPLAPTKKTITLDDISPKQAEVLLSLKPKDNLSRLSVEKLVMTLEDKDSYVSYYRTLQFYLKMGLEIKGRIKRGIVFDEAPIFREYITNNLARRLAALSQVIKLVIKLASNSFYGKLLQSAGKYKDVILCKSRAQALHLISQPEFVDFYQITHDLSIFIMTRKNPKEDSLFFIAYVVLELAKLTLYDAHYNGIKSVMGERARVLYSDTDSLIYSCEDKDNTFIEDLKKLSWIFDFSSFKPCHELFDTQNVGKSGVFKMEALDIKEFVGLSAKLYSYILADDKGGEKKCKGISRAVVKRNITHQDYLRTVQDMKSSMTVDMNLIRSKDQQLYYQTVKKTALSGIDLKRFILENGFDTLALGHYKIAELKDNSAAISSLTNCV